MMKNRATKLIKILTIFILPIAICMNISLDVNADKHLEEIASWSYKTVESMPDSGALLSSNEKGTLDVVGPSSLGISSNMIGAKGWKIGDYWLIYVDASEYENMAFEFTLRGTKNAPANWELDYSLDNNEWTAIDDFLLPFKDGESIASFYVDSLPKRLNQHAFYLRLMVKDGTIVKNGEAVDKFHAGAYANLNNIYITGKKVSDISYGCSCEEVYIDSVSTEVFANEKVFLKCNTEGAVIYYNTDESENYIPYSRPLEITQDTTITAFAFSNGYTDSAIKKFAITIIADDDAQNEVSEVVKGQLGHESGKFALNEVANNKNILLLS